MVLPGGGAYGDADGAPLLGLGSKVAPPVAGNEGAVDDPGDVAPAPGETAPCAPAHPATST